VSLPDLRLIQEASRRIKPFIHRTPLLSSTSIREITGCELYFKCENLQKAGAFKSRGACNAVFSLNEGAIDKGVCTHSSGNHAQALARAAGLRKMPAYIVMPETAPRVKINAVKGYGGIITFCKPTLAARESTLMEVAAKTGATEIHPYNDYRVITGQATCCLEILEDIPAPDIIITPVGGGGLLSGTALTAAYVSSQTKIFAAEPKGADDAYRSFYSKTFFPSENPRTIADGLLTSLGSLTFPIILEHVDHILTVEENTIIQAMRLIWERMKIIIEPSAAVTLGTVLENPELFAGKRTVIILSGGNTDLDHIPWYS